MLLSNRVLPRPRKAVRRENEDDEGDGKAVGHERGKKSGKSQQSDPRVTKTTDN